jgi:23S rRNA (guanine2445-N2)-methyltransferase / 23S rRNA (guanine2069-N7)-methyltransferase
MVLDTLVKLFDLPASRIVVKTRARQKGKNQYQRVDQRQQRHMVHENGAWLWVNLHDYLDTGLFLDHRPVRLWLQQQAKGKRVLNLFAYTCTASVHAALGGARETVSVDMSQTYLAWGRANFNLNGFSAEQHRLVAADVRRWLEQTHEQFDLIFLDPPTFSNSARMDGVLDVQRDHVDVEDVTTKSIPPDYQSRRQAHGCWRIAHRR